MARNKLLIDGEEVQRNKRIVLILPETHRQKTLRLAAADGRSPSNFARALYLRALEQYVERPTAKA